jgi:hypothetical protein
VTFRRDDTVLVPATVVACPGHLTLIRLPGGCTAWADTRLLIPRSAVTVHRDEEETKP